MIKLVLLLMALQITLQECSKGCLICADNECTLCDPLEFYILESTTCVKVSRENCLSIGLNGQCLVCDNTSFMDNQSCVPVQNLIDGCDSYSNATTCQQCQEGYASSTGNCVQVSPSEIIAGCLFYSDVQTCTGCAPNAFLSNGTCVNFPTTSNCSTFNEFECSQCNDQFILNRNLYITTFEVDTLTNKQNQISRMRSTVRGIQSKMNHDVCQRVDLSNCTNFSTFTQCQVCDEGFYLNAMSECVQNPNPRIDNCDVFSDGLTCTKCAVGYILSINPTITCRAILDTELIEGCATYDREATVVFCTSCVDAQFLINPSRCNTRALFPIDFCSTYTVNADNCATCRQSYFLNNFKTTCNFKVPNCKENALDASQTPICTQCNDEFRLISPTRCELGPLNSNCDQFLPNSFFCSTCKNGFWISSNQCNSNNSQINCSLQSQARQNICLECQNNNLPFRVAETCTQVNNLIDFCEEYVNTGTLIGQGCQKCKSGYTLSGSQQCQELMKNCASLLPGGSIRTQCQICKDGFGVGIDSSNADGNQKCVTPLSNIEFCSSSSTIRFAYEFKCNTCQNNTFPYDVTEHYLCMKRERFVDFNQSLRITNRNNCARYNANGNCVKCVNSFLNRSDNTCSSSCSSPKTIIKLGNSPTELEIKDVNICEDGITDNTEYFGPSIGDGIGKITLTCQGTNQKIADYDQTFDSVNSQITLKYSNLNLDQQGDPSVTENRFLNVEPEITCGVISASDTVTNCDKYKSGDQLCSQCDFRYYGQTISNNFISECRLLSNCAPEKYLNVHPYWSQLFSCNKSQNDNLIPIAVYQGVSQMDLKFNNYTPISTDLTLDSHLLLENTVDALVTGLKLQNSDNVTIIANCGGYILNTNGLTVSQDPPTTGLFKIDNFNNSEAASVYRANSANQAMMCAFCKPSYRASNTERMPLIANSCTQIANCDTTAANNTAVNACLKCQVDHVHEYLNDEIAYHRDCIPIPTDSTQNLSGLEQCHAMIAINNRCMICNKGYNLNKDFRCEMITAPNCESWSQKLENNQFNPKNAAYLVYAFSQGFGCNQCLDTNAEASIINNGTFFLNQPICLQSNYFSSTQNYLTLSDDTDSFYIDRCRQYSVPTPSAGTPGVVTSLECLVCDSDYILSTNKKCVLKSRFLSCQIADNTNTATDDCFKCENNFGVVQISGIVLCRPNEIPFCQEVRDEAIGGTITSEVSCTKCNSGYYLTSQNTCLRGNVSNCQQFENNNENMCTICETGFILIGSALLSESQGVNGQANTPRSYCFRNPNVFLCKEAEITGMNAVDNFPQDYARYRCNVCNEPNFFPRQVQQTQTPSPIFDNFCLASTVIANCETYLIGKTFVDTNFSCSKCSTGFYRTNLGYQCTQRQNLDQNCSEYDLSVDECLACNSNYFLSNSRCISNPTGIINCIGYVLNNQILTCNRCQANFFLSGQVCTSIPQDERILNCLYYATATECSVCEPSYFLTPSSTVTGFVNSCVFETVADCNVYSTATSCEVCDDGFRLIGNGNQDRTCELFSVPNCATFEQTGTNNCTKCNQNYFLDQGACSPANSVIPNCIENLNVDTCKVCSLTFALSTDGKSCVSKGNFDANCMIQNQPSSLVCSSCEPGYFFSNSGCVAITGSTSFANGCFLTQIQSSTCQMCYTGYYMNNNQLCVSNTPVVPPVIESVDLRSILAVILFFIIF